MLNKSLFPRPNHYDYLFSVGEGEGGNSGEGGGGGGGNPPSGGDNPPAGGGDNPPSGGEKTFTQADVDKAASARAAEAKRKAAADLAEQLGVPIDRAKEIISASLAEEEAQKTEAQKAKDAADQAKREAEEAKATAARELQAARIERALIKVHVRDDCLEDSLALLKVEEDATPEEIVAAVEAFKDRRPEFFGTEEDGTRRNPPPGDPKGKPAGKKTEDAFARGAERAKKVQGASQYPILQNQQ